MCPHVSRHRGTLNKNTQIKKWKKRDVHASQHKQNPNNNKYNKIFIPSLYLIWEYLANVNKFLLKSKHFAKKIRIFYTFFFNAIKKACSFDEKTGFNIQFIFSNERAIRRVYLTSTTRYLLVLQNCCGLLILNTYCPLASGVSE